MSIQKLQESELWVEHTKKAISWSGNSLSLYMDIESVYRDFVSANISTFPEQLNTAKQIIFVNIRQYKSCFLDKKERCRSIDMQRSFF